MFDHPANFCLIVRDQGTAYRHLGEKGKQCQKMMAASYERAKSIPENRHQCAKIIVILTSGN